MSYIPLQLRSIRTVLKFLYLSEDSDKFCALTDQGLKCFSKNPASTFGPVTINLRAKRIVGGIGR